MCSMKNCLCALEHVDPLGIIITPMNGVRSTIHYHLPIQPNRSLGIWHLSNLNNIVRASPMQYQLLTSVVGGYKFVLFQEVSEDPSHRSINLETEATLPLSTSSQSHRRLRSSARLFVIFLLLLSICSQFVTTKGEKVIYNLNDTAVSA